MYVVLEKNRLRYPLRLSTTWHGTTGSSSSRRKRTYPIDYGHLEIDVHKNGNKYLTGFLIDRGNSS